MAILEQVPLSFWDSIYLAKQLAKVAPLQTKSRQSERGLKYLKPAVSNELIALLLLL